MKVFISWSGNRSRAVAELLREWIKCVLQATRPWISTHDIERGSIWFNAINEQLQDTSVGIVCLTQENRDNRWILFEAGALAKGLSTARVCTFLIDLTPADITDPLAQFNHTLPQRQGLLNLMRTLNIRLESNALDDATLATVFDTYWPQFEARFAKALEQHPIGEVMPPRDSNDVLAEILSNTRSTQSRLNALEKRARLVEIQKDGGQSDGKKPWTILFNEGAVNASLALEERSKLKDEEFRKAAAELKKYVEELNSATIELDSQLPQ